MAAGVRRRVQGRLTFIYWIDPPLTPEAGMFCYKGRWYQMMGVDLDEYRNHMRAARPSGRRWPCRRRISARLPARSKAGYDPSPDEAPDVHCAAAPVGGVRPCRWRLLRGRGRSRRSPRRRRSPATRLEGYESNVFVENDSTALTWLFFVLLGVLAIGFFKNAKRSHLD